jgi:hypothetical protein
MLSTVDKVSIFDKELIMNGQQDERSDATGLNRADAIAIRILGVLAAAFAAVTLVVGIPGVIGTVAGDTVTLPLMLIEPVTEQTGNPAILSAQTDELTVTAAGVGSGVRATLAVGAALGTLIAAAVGVVIALFLWRLAQGRPFHRSLFAASLVAGLAMSIGGLISAFAAGFGAMQLAMALDPDGEVFVPGFSFDPTLMFAGLVVLALAYVFRAGTRLQRDTEGLV